jgi:hypothetical protein
MGIRFLGTGVLFTLAVAGCALETEEEPATTQPAELKGANEGTDLSLQTWATPGTCDGINVLVDHYAILTTTGSVDSAIVTIDGVYVMTVEPQDFTHHGRVKTWEFAEVAKEAPGFYSMEVCATQSGAQGRPSKRACTMLEYDAVCGTVQK